MTDKRAAEESAGHFKYFGYGFTPRASVAVRRLDDLNAANTNILAVGNEAWALWEGGSPWRVNASDLSTIGRKQFPDELDGLPFSAHPKRGPDGDIWNFGAIGDRCVIWRLDRNGAVKTGALVELPAASLMHDFAITRTKIVLVLPPLLASGASGPALVDRYSWRPEEPLRILILDKNDLTRQRIVELPPRFLFHIGNAWEDEAGAIRFDACLLEDSSFATGVARDLALGRYAEHLTARPTLITVGSDGRGGMAAMDGAGEFPRTDPRRVGEENRVTYGIVEFGIAAWNWRTGETASHIFSQMHWSEEPVFVPRSDRSAEQDGWVITTSLNTRAQRTELAIFEASRIKDGPIAMFACPYVLPLGFHGAFVPRA
jgi:carotenoid cleavage dioxygenase-like enzyme